MSNITFTHGKEDGQKWDHEDFKLDYELVYMTVEAGETGGTFSGWVSPEVRRLIHAAPQYQREVYEYEALLGQLKKAFDTDDFDAARDLVKAEYDAIHGPSDDR